MSGASQAAAGPPIPPAPNRSLSFCETSFRRHRQLVTEKDFREVDQLRNVLILPPERMKAGGKTGERRIALSAPALQILSRRSAGSDAKSMFVFPAAGRRARNRAATGVHESTHQGKSGGTENSRPTAFVRELRCRGRRQPIPRRQAAWTCHHSDLCATALEASPSVVARRSSVRDAAPNPEDQQRGV